LPRKQVNYKTRAIGYLEREYLNHKNTDTAGTGVDSMLDALRNNPSFNTLTDDNSTARYFL
jgi:hypothetical protein